MASKIAETGVPQATGSFLSELFSDEPSARYRDILRVAATLFANRGYAATSIRDIGEAVGLMGGSLYHHIKSKDALFVRIHDAALDMAGRQIRDATAQHTDPWNKFESACVRFCQIQLDPDSVTMPLMSDFMTVPPDVRRRLIVKRDEFEQIFVALIDTLPLGKKIDQKVYRLLLLSLLNSVNSWYRPGRLTPESIGKQIVLIFRHETW
jgi:AcrR family transcriptional regulator